MSSTVDIDALPKVMGDDGEFHATDEAVDMASMGYDKKDWDRIQAIK